MPWCPNCKTEYREGISVCSDCKAELVAELDEERDGLVPLFQTEGIKVADKLLRYFEYSGLKAVKRFDEENEVYVISVPAELENKAKKLYQAFYFVEREKLDKQDTSKTSGEENDISTEEEEIDDVQTKDTDLTEVAEEDSSLFNEEGNDFIDNSDESQNDEESDDSDDFDQNDEPSSYVMKADEYKDLSGTVWIFLLFGILGIAVVLLNVVGVLNFINGIIPTLVMGGLFLFFIYVGITTNSKAKKVQTEIEAENKLTESINLWLKDNITESFLASIHNDKISDELNFIKKTDIIKEMLIKEFGNQNLAYLDHLIEDYYSSTFEGKEE